MTDTTTRTAAASSPLPAALPVARPGEPPGEPAPHGKREAGMGRAAAVTAALTAAGSGLGLLRDQAVARLFGAGAQSDAFLVAWTVPEVAATLLIEDAMAFVMVPAFSRVLARDGDVRRLVRGTLPRLLVLLGVLTAAVAGGAPLLVRVLAPGLADPATAAACTRLTAVTVLAFGVTGYLSAALRAHRRFVPPAGIYVAYNVGIVGTLLALHGRWGVRAAAAGVAVGGVLMVVVQLPAALRVFRTPAPTSGVRSTPAGGDSDRPPPPVTTRAADVADRAHAAPAAQPTQARTPRGTPAPTSGVSAPRASSGTPAPAPGVGPAGACPGTPAPAHDRRAASASAQGGGAVSVRSGSSLPGRGGGLVVGVAVFTVGRQAQVLVERYFGAGLGAGAISHLNYAQKVAQLPMVLSLMVCAVTFPAVSRALAAGDARAAGRRVERDLALVCVVVLVGTAYVVAAAPQIVRLLFQRGEFGAGDTAATAAVMRVYAVGLLGQSLVGALVRPYFSAGATWRPAGAMGVGLAVTAAVDAAGVRVCGASGIAAGNALGITVTAALLLRGLAARGVPVRVRDLAPRLGRFAVAAAAATTAGWAVAGALPDPLTAAAACALAVPAAFLTAAAALHRVRGPGPLATNRHRETEARP